MITPRLRLSLPNHIPNRLLSHLPINLPSRKDMPLGKDLLDLFQRPLRGLREAEKDMNAGGKVERAKDEVGFVGDGGETGRDGPGEGKVEEPVGGGGDGDGFGADTHWEDLGGVGPGDGTHGDGEGTDEEVGADDDGFGSRVVVGDHPDTWRGWGGGVSFEFEIMGFVDLRESSTSPQCPKRPCRPPTRKSQKPIRAVPAINMGRRPHRSM